MLKTFAWIVALLSVSLLAACGGGEAGTAVPVDAKVCDLKLATSPEWPYDTSAVRTDTDYAMVQPTVSFNSEGRYQITSMQPFYVNVSVLDATGGIRYGSSYADFVGSVARTVTLAPDLFYRITYAPIVGTVGGDVLLSTVWYDILRFGTPSDRDVQPSDVVGMEMRGRDAIRILYTPDLLLTEENVFRVQHPFSPGSWPFEPANVSYAVVVGEDCYHCGKSQTLSCTLKGLKTGDIVALVGGERGKGIRLYVSVYSSVLMDDGRTAISQPATLHINY